MESTDGGLGPDLVQRGPYRVGAYTRVFEGGVHGGDRYGLCLTRSNDLFFYLADAPGHGRMGDQFWAYHGETFQSYWQAFARADPSSKNLREFALKLNKYFHGWSDESSQSKAALCLLFGVVSPGGEMLLANCGYGNHALITNAQGAWRSNEPSSLIGLKLGWVPNETWDLIEGSFTTLRVEGVTKCAMITDGFLDDDHADPQRTLATVEDLASQCASTPASNIIPTLRELPHDKDDATILVIEIGERSTI